MPGLVCWPGSEASDRDSVSSDTDAPAGVASGRLAAGSALMRPHLL